MRDLFRRANSRRDQRLARDVRLELEHHLAASTEFLIDQGLPAEDARTEAARRLGELQQAQARLIPYARDRERTMRIRDWLQSVMQDVRYAGRSLSRQPILTAVVVGTLALGIGANAAMFGILDRLLMSGPAHVDDADRVVRVYFTRTPENGLQRTFARTNYATYTALRDAAASFQSVAAYSTFERMLGEGPDAEPIDVQQTTWTLFPLLGVEPAIGRFYDAREDTPPRGQPVAVLSHAFWTRHFGADPSVLGEWITLGDDRYTILGVAPRGFTGAELGGVDVWVPISSGIYEPRPDWTTTWNARWLTILGRLAPGVSAGVAGTEATAVHRQAYGGSQDAERDLIVSARPLLYGDEGQEPMEATVSRWLAGVAAIVLLIACANVASLLLARGMRRRREVVLRVALGISQGRLARLLAAEGVVLAAGGGIAALFVAHWGGGILQAVLLPDIAWEGVASGGRLLFFTAAATFATALVVAPLPALQGLRLRLTQTLKDGGSETRRARSSVRYGLTTAQAALSVVLLIGAGLFIQSLARVQQLDLGIETDLVVTADLTWPDLTSDLSDDERRAELIRRAGVRRDAIDRTRALPGVASASASIGLPFWSAFGVDLRVPGLGEVPELPGGGPFIAAVFAGYFETVGTDIVRGRAFDANDGAGTAPVSIVSETMAATLWPGQEALGQCLLIGDGEVPCAEVVGIAEDTRRWELEEAPALQYYVPVGQQRGISGLTLLVRRTAEAAVVEETIKGALFDLDPTLRYVSIRTLQERIDPQVRPWRLGASLFTAFGALAFVIAALGLYSVVAYVTEQRTHELGVRLALGAQKGVILWLVLRSGLAMAATGIAAGVLLALAAGPEIEPLLFDTSARSPLVFAVVAGVLLITTLAASFIPARRATRVDPVVALRS